MEINTTSGISVTINNEVIEQEKNIKYLGFMTENELKFRDHIDYNCKNMLSQTY